jgi:hypothetical protein
LRIFKNAYLPSLNYQICNCLFIYKHKTIHSTLILKKIYDTEKAKKWIVCSYGTYIYDEQEHMQCTHGMIYNFEIFISILAKVYYGLTCCGQSNQSNILEKTANFNQAEHLLKINTNMHAYNYIGQ